MHLFLPILLPNLVPLVALDSSSPSSMAPTVLPPLELTLTASPAPSTLDPAAPVDEHSYFLVSGGLVTTRSSSGPGEEIDFDEGWSLGLTYGNEFHTSVDGDTRWSWELDGYYSDQDVDDEGLTQAVRDVNVAAVLGNVVGEWALGESVALTAGAGVGVGWLNAGGGGDALSDFEEEDGPHLAWQGKVGLHLAKNSATSWHLGYRFLNIDDVELDEEGGDASFDLETEQHVVELVLHLRL